MVYGDHDKVRTALPKALHKETDVWLNGSIAAGAQEQANSRKLEVVDQGSFSVPDSE